VEARFVSSFHASTRFVCACIDSVCRVCLSGRRNRYVYMALQTVDVAGGGGAGLVSVCLFVTSAGGAVLVSIFSAQSSGLAAHEVAKSECQGCGTRDAQVCDVPGGLQLSLRPVCHLAPWTFLNSEPHGAGRLSSLHPVFTWPCLFMSHRGVHFVGLADRRMDRQTDRQSDRQTDRQALVGLAKHARESDLLTPGPVYDFDAYALHAVILSTISATYAVMLLFCLPFL
jgi:hypothetical protein